MPGHNNQQSLRMLLKYSLMSVKQLLVFSGVRAAGNPDRASPKLLTQGTGSRTHIIRYIDIKFHATSNLNVGGGNANAPKPVSIPVSLRRHPGNAFHDRRGQPFHPLITASGTLGQARVDQENRDPPPAALADHIGPDFSLENHEDPRVDSVQKTTDSARCIVWGIRIG